MIQDRRTTTRFVVNCPASIVGPADSAKMDCLVADMSDGGVRLCALQSEVPEEFVPSLKDGSGVSRKCRIVWHLDDEIGAEFI